MDEPRSMTIEICVTGGVKEATIHCNGETHVVDGLALFGDAEGAGEMFSFWWNSPKCAAKAFVRSLERAVNTGDDWALQFYRCIFRMLAQATGVSGGKTISPGELLEKWDREDQEAAEKEYREMTGNVKVH